MPFNVEFLIAYTDHTWDVVQTLLDIPSGMTVEEEDGWLCSWARGHYLDPKNPHPEITGEVAALAVHWYGEVDDD